ncbi:Hypothetical protein PHPALM_7539 [Phytophthora palmivora]|uniref:Uncharacterized protein n=1 Tax=Phytophthora palmivora TaxID=4796 RepID=A0A2P4YCE8_9STRA|nr:Hypothetical protein PHPALM_7539 [Phytophthora palmivora]
MSEETSTSLSTNASSSGTAGDATGTGPATATVDTVQGGDAFGAPRLLSTEEVDRLFHQGLMTSESPPVTSFGDSDALHNYIAPNIEPEGRAFLISVPARAEDFQRGRHIANAYGGPCVLEGYETLTDEDLQELERVIPSFDPHETITPRAQTLNVPTLDALASLVEVRREMASLLSHVSHTRLAERVFRTAGYLKLMTAAHRRLRERVGSQNGVALIDAAAARSECEEIKREWVLNCQYWKHQLQVAQQDGVVEERMSSEIRDLKAHYQDQVEALKADKAALKSQVADLQAQVSILKSRPDVKPTDPWGFSEFLQENPEISGNWNRLHDLLVSYQENTIVPDHWTTIINVTALDERKKPPVEDSVLSANASTTVVKSDVYKKLPGDVVWKEVRPDLRQALLSGVAYDKAMEWLASDKEAHSLFSSPVLVQMLMADEVVDRHLSAGTKPAAWGDLDGHVNYPESDSEDDDDDSGNDISDDSNSGGGKSKSKTSGVKKSGNKKSKGKKSKSKKSDDHSHSGSKRPRESEDDSDSDNGPIVPTQMSKRCRASVIAHTSPKSHPKSTSGSGSKSKAPSRRSRSLVSKPYKSLSVRELQVVETPDRDASSWLYYGIRVQRGSSTKTSTSQILGFPDYEVHKHSCSILKGRWDSERYCAVIRKKRAPWEVMFNNRFSEFYFHKRDDLDPMVLANVEEIVHSMRKHAQAYWERTPWVTMDDEADDKSAELHKYRAMRRAVLVRQHNALVRKALANRDFPKSLLSEPGIWTVPDKACPWIWQDPRVTELGGPKCLSLETQLGDLDAIEPTEVPSLSQKFRRKSAHR